MRAYPMMQHILGAHIATSYKLHVPPLYAVEAHKFTISTMVRALLYKVDQYAKTEKDAKLKKKN